LLAHGWWFSLGTAASSTTKTGRHDVAEIFAENGIKHKKSINQNQPKCSVLLFQFIWLNAM
jgi:hypothetical protein